MANLTSLLDGLKVAGGTTNAGGQAPPVVPPVPPPAVVDPPQQQPAETPKLNTYKVVLEGQPAEVVEAKDRLDAIYVYNKKLGIISTTRNHDVTEVVQ